MSRLNVKFSPISSMASFLQTLLSWIARFISDKAQTKARYRIINYDHVKAIVSFQCNTTRACFSEKLQKTVEDSELISQLSPDQACYLGIMYGKKYTIPSRKNIRTKKGLNKHMLNNKNINYVIFNRFGNIIFIYPKTQKRNVITIEHVISTHGILRHFSSVVACSIGIRYGLKETKATKKIELRDNNEVNAKKELLHVATEKYDNIIHLK